MVRSDAVGYTAKEAAKRVGLPYAMLDAYARGASPVLRPSVNPGGGQGTRRAYSFRDLIALRIADHLRLIGVRTSVIAAVVAHVQNEDQGIDTPEQVQAHRGLWVAIRAHRGEVGRPFSIHSPPEAKRITAEGSPVSIVVDVIALGRELSGRRSRVFVLPPRRSKGRA